MHRISIIMNNNITYRYYDKYIYLDETVKNIITTVLYI